MNTPQEPTNNIPGTKAPLLLRVIIISSVLLLTGAILLRPIFTGKAAAILTIEPTTWNVVGLNSTNVNVGPNIFPVSARLCNSGDAAATNVVSIFIWDSDNANINLTGVTSISLPSLAAGACTDLTYYVTITRDAAAYNTSRGYRIVVTADGLGTISTPTPREIYVEHLNPNDNLSVVSFTGPSSVIVGQTYQYIVQASTAADTYGQLEHFVFFPRTIFDIVSIQTTYSVPVGATNDTVYADACGWQNDPTLAGYRSCVGPPGYPGGVVGGNVVTTFTVRITAPGAATIFSTLTGFTAGEYRYNSDAGVDSITVMAASSPTLTPTSTASQTLTATATLTGTPHTPTPTSTATTTGTHVTPTLTGTIIPNPGATKAVSPAEAKIGEKFTFTIRVVNPGTAPATNVIVEDSFDSYTYLDIYDLTTTKGTKNITGRKAVVKIGTLNPGESVTITIIIRVNNSAVGTTTPCNLATVKFTSGTTRNSNQVCFKVVGGSSLPGTGEIALQPNEPAPPAWLAFGSIFLGIAGTLLVLIGLVAMIRRMGGLWKMIGLGLFLVALGALAGFMATNMQSTQSISGASPILIEGDLSSAAAFGATASATPNPLAALPNYLLDTPAPFETLPVFPVPSPTLEATSKPGEPEPDTSSIVRIVIPTLKLDAKVAYVPFDGKSWFIRGLREEVAWLGDTSWPGLGGNTALAGHITVAGYGDGPFRYLADLLQNDEVILYTERGTYTYRVREKVIVDETEMWVTAPTENAQITLITCVDWDDRLKIYLKRLVVFADKVDGQISAY